MSRRYRMAAAAAAAVIATAVAVPAEARDRHRPAAVRAAPVPNPNTTPISRFFSGTQYGLDDPRRANASAPVRPFTRPDPSFAPPRTAGPALTRPGARTVRPPRGARQFRGVASYYWQGQRVASGGRFNPHGLTAAHRTLPFGTKVRVTDPRSGRSVIVTINDRGPFVRGRVLDLSLGAARVLGMTGRGVMMVQADVI